MLIFITCDTLSEVTWLHTNHFIFQARVISSWIACSSFSLCSLTTVRLAWAGNTLFFSPWTKSFLLLLAFYRTTRRFCYIIWSTRVIVSAKAVSGVKDFSSSTFFVALVQDTIRYFLPVAKFFQIPWRTLTQWTFSLRFCVTWSTFASRSINTSSNKFLQSRSALWVFWVGNTLSSWYPRTQNFGSRLGCCWYSAL